MYEKISLALMVGGGLMVYMSVEGFPLPPYVGGWVLAVGWLMAASDILSYVVRSIFGSQDHPSSKG